MIAPAQSHARPLYLLIVFYFASSALYSLSCGLLGRDYARSVGALAPLATFQVYAVGMAASLAVALLVGRKVRAWRWSRVWPPSAPASRAAVASVLILTASTLALLSPQSLVSNLAGKAGCLLLVASLSDRTSLAVAGLAALATLLASWGKPLRAQAVPLALAALYVFGYWVKLRAVAEHSRGRPLAAQDDEAGHRSDAMRQVAQSTAQPPESRDDFLSTEQAMVSLLALVLAAAFSHAVKPAPLADWRIWLTSAASLSAGLFGTWIMLRAEPASLTFPAYRMASLLASLGASVTRGELGLRKEHLPGWSAALLACLVVVFASLGDERRGRVERTARRLLSGLASGLRDGFRTSTLVWRHYRLGVGQPKP